MKREFRLTKSTEFERVRRRGKSYAHPFLVLVALANQKEQSRFGIAAGKAIGNAVNRNRAKRQIRAALNEMSPLIAPGFDNVVIARPPLTQASYQQILAALHSLLRRANLLTDQPVKSLSQEP